MFWLELGTPTTVPAGTLVWQGGEPGTFAVVLLEGELEVVEEAPSGDTLVLHVLEEQELAGETACLQGTHHSAALRARTECRLRRIPAADLRRAAQDPEHLAALLALQSQRVRRLTRQVAVLGFDPVARRLARLLAAQPDEVRLTHGDLAERVATTRESVTKALAWLSRQGLVETRRGSLRILDRKRLEALIG